MAVNFLTNKDKAELEAKIAEKANKTEVPTSFATTYSATVTTEWTEDTKNGGYSQTVAVPGIASTDNPIVDIVLGDDIDANALHLEAWGRISRITTASNKIILYAYEEAPETAFNIQLKVVR